ncbi:hypothetical protein NXS19_011037 [Fusarium pseudograminearum]|nr:hypothetical protein NXS19_011037 [Fusarium pseudograminearum]
MAAQIGTEPSFCSSHLWWPGLRRHKTMQPNMARATLYFADRVMPSVTPLSSVVVSARLRRKVSISTMNQVSLVHHVSGAERLALLLVRVLVSVTLLLCWMKKAWAIVENSQLYSDIEFCD